MCACHSGYLLLLWMWPCGLQLALGTSDRDPRITVALIMGCQNKVEVRVSHKRLGKGCRAGLTNQRFLLTRCVSGFGCGLSSRQQDGGRDKESGRGGRFIGAFSASGQCCSRLLGWNLNMQPQGAIRETGRWRHDSGWLWSAHRPATLSRIWASPTGLYLRWWMRRCCPRGRPSLGRMLTGGQTLAHSEEDCEERCPGCCGLCKWEGCLESQQERTWACRQRP